MELTPKQEAFAQKYIELGNASEAYRQSYDAENMKSEAIHVEACRLLQDPNVALRVKELKELHLKRHCITIDSITQQLMDDRQFAREKDQAAVALNATVHTAKLHGLLTDKTELTGKDGKDLIPQERSTMEVARSIAFVLASASQEKGNP